MQIIKPTTIILLDKRRTKKTGLYPVKLRITFAREQRYYPIGCDLSETEFDQTMNPKSVDLKLSVQGKRVLKENKYKIDSFFVKTNEIIQSIPDFSFTIFEQKMFGIQTKAKDVYSIYQQAIQEMRRTERIGTAENYTTSMHSLQLFSPKLEFKQITASFLYDYEKWLMSKGRSISTVGIYLRPLRAILNLAIEEGLMNKEDYPFGKRRYVIPASKNIKKALTLSEIGKIYHYEAIAGTWWQKAKDFWLFSYFANGMNIKDLANLTKDNIKGDFLIFTRAKTMNTNRSAAKQISIPLSDDLRKIINTWHNSNSDYLFPVLKKGMTPLEQHKTIAQCVKMINSYIRLIAEKVGIEKNITTYHARHSFATVLKRSGASTEFISESLGHSNIGTTSSYLDSFEDETKKEIMKALRNF
jgi:integrase/recombinase XerD